MSKEMHTPEIDTKPSAENISFKHKLRLWLKQFSLLVGLKRQVWSLFNGTSGVATLNVIRDFPLFQPYSVGSYEDRASLTIQAINQVFSFLQTLVKKCAGQGA